MFVTLCSHVLVAVKLVYIYSCIDTELINENSFHQNQFLIWYQSDFLDASNFLMVSQINFGNSLFFSFTIIIFFNFSQAFLIHFELFLSTIVVFYKLLKLFQWQKQQQLMLPPQRLHLLHKIRIILVILCSCILEKIQEQFSLLNHWLGEKIILLRLDQWENL